MPYVSPLKLLKDYKLPVELKLDKDTLRIARQALLAEIDLSPRQSVMIGQKEMTRNDILNLFDTLQEDENWKYHEVLHQDQALLDFFTEYKLPKSRIAKNAVYDEPEFAVFLESFYPEVYANAFEQVLREPTFEQVTALFRLPEHWFTASSRRQADVLIKQQLRKVLNNLEALIKPYKDKTGLLFKKKLLEPYYDPNIIEVLNKLPESYSDIRYHYGMHLIEAAYVLWNNKNKADSNYIVRRVESLQGNHNLDYQIRHYWSQCSGSTTTVETSESSGVSPWMIIAIVVFIIRMVNLCSNTSSSSHADSSRLPRIEHDFSSGRYKNYKDGIATAPMPGYSKSKKQPVEKKSEKISEENMFFNPKVDRMEELLYRIDSAVLVHQPTTVVTEYEKLYKQIKKSNSLDKPVPILKPN